MSALEKKLKISCGVVKRLSKEVAMYEKEVEKQKARIAALTEKGEDAATIRKQNEVLQESVRMIPDTQQRLQSALELLRNQVDSVGEDDPEDIKLTQIYTTATQLLE